MLTRGNKIKNNHFILTLFLITNWFCTIAICSPAEIETLNSMPPMKTGTLTAEKPIVYRSPMDTSSRQQDISIMANQNPDYISSPTSLPVTQDTYTYETQSGDTLPALAARFGVNTDEIKSEKELPATSFLESGIKLTIPKRLKETSKADRLFPDSEVIFSMTSTDLNIHTFVASAGGFLNTYSELRSNGWYSGADIIKMTALDYSISPRMLLTMLEYQSGWVYGKPTTKANANYPLGIVEKERELLFSQVGLTAQNLIIGYYGWRTGSLTSITFPDGTSLRLDPTLNAGTVAVMTAYSKINNRADWEKALYSEDSMLSLYVRMFGDPWKRAKTIGPLIPANLTQPTLELPLEKGRPWNLTGGPHAAWGTLGTRAALDFAPAGIKSCSISREWVTAVAPGLVVRVGEGPLILDLDGDGYEQSGWNILYMHIAAEDRTSEGKYLKTDDKIGHPSCYGGKSTGTHMHIARKYNGEWMLAEGPVPFILGGWMVKNAPENYYGQLVKNGNVIQSSLGSIAESLIIRD